MLIYLDANIVIYRVERAAGWADRVDAYLAGLPPEVRPT